MKIIENLDELWNARKKLPEPVGLVPTMGYLHKGHISLVERAREECPSVVVSIFVNPTQFAPEEDLESYPRDIDKDLKMLEAAGADLVWMPTSEIMYPEGFQTWVDVKEVTKPLEGSMRPGHFRGVTTVVAKLFNGVQPQKAFFGQKDAQQIAVIQQMTRDLNFPVEIVVCPTVREDDGLAMSSRNSYLNAKERKAATVLYRALTAAEKVYNDGEKSGKALRNVMEDMINSEPLAKSQYVSCVDRNKLEELEEVEDGALLSMAVFVGKTRLIDNWILR